MSTQDDVSGAQIFEITLLPGGRVSLDIQFATLYEAAVAYQTLVEAAKTGKVKLAFGVGRLLGHQQA